MAPLLDRLGLWKRKDTRVAVRRTVDVQIRDTDSFIGYQTLDLSRSGLRLQARTSETLERVLRPKGGVPMRLRLPAPYGQIEFEAELTWERDVDGKALSGWTYRRISRAARSAIEEYIKAHPGDVVQEPDQEHQGDG